MDDNEDFDFDDIVLNVCETSTCDVQPYAFEPCAAADVSSKSNDKSFDSSSCEDSGSDIGIDDVESLAAVGQHVCSDW